MAFHLENVPGLPALRFSYSSGSIASWPVSSFEIPVLLLIQGATILAATVLAAVTLWRIRVNAVKKDVRIRPWGWRAVVTAVAVYVLTSLFLVLSEGA